ncbi:MAG: group II intron reverse transcriptase/maturase [Proteobacteria bacterium]|nr:group II intron reverse transcriptase/maturase [Pseudomonadota bacterium]
MSDTPSNGLSTADCVERRATTKGNSQKSAGEATQCVFAPLFGLERVRQAAKKDKKQRFTALLHHLDLELLGRAYQKLNKEAATGVDDVTWESYGENLEENLEGLHERVHKGRYRAKPSKRIWIPKSDGKQRPIGIASLEDKIVQQGLIWILEVIYEEDFKGFSYGFRPARNQHMALDAVYVAITQRKVSWVLDADIRGFFDNINHNWLMRFLEHRVGDKRVLRLVKKFLRAGVSEDGQWSMSKSGTPQGAVISPLLANIYLHYALDLWVNHWRKTKARGEVIIIRYADDFIMGFQYRDDAESMLRALKERMAKFNLELHEDKTRLIEFGRFAMEDCRKRKKGKPESFDFLGFTHRCAKRRSDGHFTVRRETIKKRLKAKLDAIKIELRRRMHHKVAKTGQWLRSVINGYLNYYSVPGNQPALTTFRSEICKAWVKTLRRRSQAGASKKWARYSKLIRTWIPSVIVRHPYPNQRLIV